MQASTPLLTQLPSYARLQSLATSLANASVEDMFRRDRSRHEDFVLQACGLELDYSKQLLNKEALSALLQLATDAELPRAIASLIGGDIVNNTEERPALHTLLRARHARGLEDKLAEVQSARDTMRHWADRLNSGQQQGFSSAVITDVVNIGIGGSDLGPRLVSEALRPFQGNVACHYVANVDPADLQNTLQDLSPDTTLFIICSKSFRTEETLTNSLVAREWMRDAGASDADLDKHFLAITSNLEAAADFGIPSENCLPMWDWEIGRASCRERV